MTQLEKVLNLNFMGTSLLFRTNSSELLERLEKDFSHFVVSESNADSRFEINALLEQSISIAIPSGIKPAFTTKNSKTYDKERVRFNDYGSLISKYDYATEKGELSSASLERLHEVTYLLILSRIGKHFDLKGLHKIHALGFIYKGVCFVGMMNMGVGKSTLLMELLKDPEVELLSDDTPLVDQEGEIKAFPIRLGANEIPKELVIEMPSENIYKLVRKEYGEKKLVCLKGIKNKVGNSYKRIVVFEGVRGNLSLERSSAFSLFFSLQKHMVIGIGLPLIFEYFWESGFQDFLRKTKIFLLRQRAALKLSRNCEFYKFSLGKSSEDNARALKDLLENDLAGS